MSRDLTLSDSGLAQAVSILAASTSMIGMSSSIGYTRPHWPHFRLWQVKTTAVLHTGHTSASRRSSEIMVVILPWPTAF